MPARELRKKHAKTPYEALRGLHGARGWLGYFVGCESEAIYPIYSPEKHRVYRIGVASVEDGEGLEDPQGAPCFEDRTPTPDLEIPSHIARGDKNEASDEEDSSQVDEANYLAVFCH
ncbi:hypothetical protein L204_104335 [Cryptococcus depauperatus]|nr:hypothetical protein L204_04835 [Cryptococcus depauperatus CBS 7855]